MPFSFLNLEALDALYGHSPDGIMVECFNPPIAQATLDNSTPPFELRGIAEIAYVNQSFIESVRYHGIEFDETDTEALRAALLGLFDGEFDARWRTRPGIYIDNLPLNSHAKKLQRMPKLLMLSVTPIEHDAKVYGRCVRLTDASPAISQNAEEHRALRQIEAFVRTENASLICLEFANPLPGTVSMGELGEAYLNATLTHFTSSAAQQFGVDPKHLLGRSLHEVANEDILTLLTNAFPADNHRQLLSLGDTPELLVPVNSAKSSVFRIKPTFVFENGCAIEAWLRIDDETLKQRRMRYQKKLERTRDLALEGASLNQFEIDSKTMEIRSDTDALEAMGFTDATTKLNDWLTLIGPEDLNISKEQLLRQLKGEEKHLNFVVRLTNSTGEDRYIEFWGETTPSDPDGEPSTRILGLYRDVTQTETLNARLRDKKTLESLGVLAGGVAHDFNNMLMSVLGYAELMEADMLDAAQSERSPVIQSALHNVSEIRAAALRASELCTSLLAYAGQHLIEKKTLDLTELVRTTSELVQLTIGKRAPMVWQLDKEALISADQGQLTQVIVNLVGNAADAVDPENHEENDSDRLVSISVDTIVLDATEQAQFEAPIAEAGQPVACLTVRDSGTGMSPETMKRMYEPFFTTKSEGRGLGMAAVHGIVKHHGGGILVKSVEGEGTEFRVCFPLVAPTTDDEQNVASAQVAPVDNKPNVLVVDDESSVRRIAAEMLRHLQCDVQEADSAESALALFDDHGFDFALLDITMPVMSGTELAEILLARRPELNVVLCSGFTEKNVPEALLKRCRFIHKPFTLQEVRTALKLDEE